MELEDKSYVFNTLQTDGGLQSNGPSRPSRSGGRLTANLTPTQLARKRAHDREAQRTARQRTKDHLEGLEKRVEELSADASQLELARQRTRELEKEVAELKRTLAAASDSQASHSSWDQQQYQSIETHYLIQHGESAYKPLISSTIDDLAPYHTPFSSSDQRMMVTHTPAFIPHISTSLTNQPATYWELPVRFLPPDNSVDYLLISTLQTQRTAVREGLRFSQSLSRTPNLHSFLFPNISGPNDPVSSGIDKVLRNTAMQGLPEKVASIYMIYKALKWQIKPCLETYEDMPSWFSPRPSQLMCAHPSWVSQIKFPKLRDRVINNQHLYANDRFLAMYTAGLRVNWPFRDVDIFRFENGKVGVTDLFETHILDVDNWSLGEPFISTYPELAGLCRYTGLP